METIIKTIQEKIKSLEWSINYHKEEFAKANEERDNLKKELTQLQERNDPVNAE